ncbi:MAG: Do family serine endopeptidase [Deltaproteobacteria bacterium]|nr:Do family serine endopeptidase [Deltaproteobacteria bacterium]
MNKARSFRRFVGALIIISSLLVSYSGEASSLRRDPVVEAVQKASPAVVNISTEEMVRHRNSFSSPFSDPFFDRFFENFFEPRYEEKYTQQSLGSGVIFEKSGYILTNWHVVQKASRIKIILIDETIYEAKLVGSSPDLDLAVLKIETGRDLPTLTIGDSDTLMIGEKVIAIGNPFGLSHTVTTGVISAASRSLKAGKNVYHDFIQTDASINPGNSGGPLLNIDGDLIGINTAIYGEGAQGIGFAIPINKVKRIVDDLILYGEVTSAWVGVRVQDLTPELKQYLDYDREGGVLVRSVDPKSPAALAGIEKIDIIVAIGKHAVRTSPDFWSSLRQYTANNEISFTLFRKGVLRTVLVKAQPFPLAKAEELVFSILGIAVEEFASPPEKRQRFENEGGVVISRVKPDSRADRVGIKPGDVVLQMNEVTIHSLNDFRTAAAKGLQKETMLLLIQRGAYGYYLTIPLDS